MEVIHSNSAVESKVTPGVGVRLHPEVGASFNSCFARSRKGRGVWDGGSTRTVFGPVKEMPSVERCGSGKEKTALVQPLESLQYKKAGRRGREREASRKVDGGREADGS